MAAPTAASPAHIYLVRHGETEWNAAGRFQGRLDSPLTPKGIAQAEAVGRKLAAMVAGVDSFFASPLGRTRRTAGIVRSFRHYPEIRWEWQLAEVSMGSWESLTLADIDARWPELLAGSPRSDYFFRSPDGESYEHAAERVRGWLSHVQGTVIAISHGLLGRIIRGVYLGLPRDQALALPGPHDVIWHMTGGRVIPLSV